MTTVKPDPQDFEAVAREHGEARSDKEQAHHYRLAQVHKMIRLYDAGKLPLELMREMDKIRDAGR